jgi:hypothetical protein
MKGIWIVAGIIFFIVLILGLWLFIFNFGGFANLFGDKAKNIVDSDDESKFYGTWTSDDSENYPYLFGKEVSFLPNGTILLGVLEDEAFYEISNGKVIITYEDGHRGTPRDYSFSDNNNVLTVTDYTWDKTAVYNKKITND